MSVILVYAKLVIIIDARKIVFSRNIFSSLNVVDQRVIPKVNSGIGIVYERVAVILVGPETVGRSTNENAYVRICFSYSFDRVS